MSIKNVILESIPQAAKDSSKYLKVLIIKAMQWFLCWQSLLIPMGTSNAVCEPTSPGKLVHLQADELVLRWHAKTVIKASAMKKKIIVIFPYLIFCSIFLKEQLLRLTTSFSGTHLQKRHCLRSATCLLSQFWWFPSSTYKSIMTSGCALT